ncbi:hypothetical protein P3X46_007313 [Hevea brasiliensis]|uniref:BURP domain-containing protein n=1 Tax=Hevea brasiliensis TaxID=3981 RepID=A0ABQ9MT48_HEVBR|nr:hypothetical protein P3X46_007313 [Hevea brasiliensis]
MSIDLNYIIIFLNDDIVCGNTPFCSCSLRWHNELPTSPSPGLHRNPLLGREVQMLIQEREILAEVTTVNVRKGGVNVNAGKGKPSGTSVNIGKSGKDVGVYTGKPGKRTNVGVGKGKACICCSNQLHDDPNVALFFLEKDMYPSKNMNFLQEIYNQFSVKQGSMEAEIIKNTMKDCEEPGIKGQEKHCATLLEMIDFSTSVLGKNVQAISKEVENQTHKEDGQNYACAVFYCHSTQTTRAYMAQAVAVCHTDTSAWNPKHLAFQVLKVKPGTVPACHFLPQDHAVWVPN